MSRVLMLGLVAVMLLGCLALVVWIFRVVFQSARGIAQTVGASPAGPLQELGLSVSSNVAGGVGQGQWKGTAVQVGWRMTAAPFAGDSTPPPKFSTTAVAFFPHPLGLGIVLDEDDSAPACGIAGLDARVRLSAAPSSLAHGLLTQSAPHIRHVLDAPGRLHITDEHVAISFEEIVGDKHRLTDTLDLMCTLHAAIQSHAALAGPR